MKLYLGDETLSWCNQGTSASYYQYLTRYLFCSKFTGKIQFLPIKGHWNGVEDMIEYP